VVGPATIGLLVAGLVALGIVVPAESASALAGDVACGDNAGLVNAINMGNGQEGGEADVSLATGCTYTLTSAAAGTDAFAAINDTNNANLVIEGNGATIRRDPSAPRFRFFELGLGGHVVIKDLTLTGGYGPDGGGGSDPAASASGGAIYSQGDLTLDNVTLTGNQTGKGGNGSGTGAIDGNSGAPSGNGGAIDNTGTLTLNNSTVTGNTTGAGGDGGNAFGNGGAGSSSGNGGGISNSGNLIVVSSTISSNTTGPGGGGGSAIDNGGPGYGGQGAGLYLSGSGSSNIQSSLISGNTTSGFGAWGGAISLVHDTSRSGSATLNVVNSTIADNTAYRAGGIYLSAATATISQDTITGNSANGTDDFIGGNVAAMDNGATMTFSNTLMAANGSSGVVDCNTQAFGDGVTYTSLGGTLSDRDSGCDRDTAIGDPKLGPLAANGGTSESRALLAGSPAIDAGVTSLCTTVDQRGVARPQGSACDVGAYELAATPPTGAISGATRTLDGIDRAYTTTSTGAIAYDWSVSGVTATITGATTATPHFTFTSAGHATVILKVSIPNATDSAATETLAVDVGPADDSPPTVAFISPASSLDEGGSLTFHYSVDDPDGDGTDMVAGFPDCGAVGTLSANDTDAKTFTCDFPEGTAVSTVRVQFEDEFGIASPIVTTDVTVNDVAPVVVITGNQTPDEGPTPTVYSYTIEDPGLDTFSPVTSCSGGISKVADSDTFTGTLHSFSGTFSCLNPQGPLAGSVRVIVTAGGAGLAVNVQNVAPTIAISGPDPTGENGISGATDVYQLNAVDPGDQATLSLVPDTASCGGPGVGTVIASSITAITCRFDHGPETATVSATVQDPDGAVSVGGSLDVEVDNVAPTVQFVQTEGAIAEGATITRHFSATDPGNDALSVTVPDECTPVAPYTTGPGTISGDLSCSYPDGPTTTTDTLVVHDGTTNVPTTITQQVNNVAPTIDASLSAVEQTATPVSLTVGAIHDPGQDTVTEWIINWGDGVSTTYTSPPGTVSHRFVRDGNITPTIDLVDEDGTYTNVGPALNVLVHNSAPVVTLTDAPTSVDEGTSSTIHFTISDEDVDDTETVRSVSCGVSSLGVPNVLSNLDVTGRTGSFDCAWVEGGSSATVTMQVSDTPTGTTESTSASVRVNDVLPTVTFSDGNPLSVTEGSATYVYDFTVSDPGPEDLLLLTFLPGTTTPATTCGTGGTLVSTDYDGGATGSVTCRFPDGPATTSPTVVIYDEFGITTISEDVTVLNAPPVVTFSALDPTTTNEGSLVGFEYSVTDPGADGWSLASPPDCGTGGTLLGSSIGNFTCVFSDGPSTGQVSVEVTDGDPTDDTASATAQIDVEDVAPTIALDGPSHQPGSPFELTLGAITDPGDDTVSSWLVHWGDGTSDTYTSATPNPTHTYTSGLSDTVTVDLTNEDGEFDDAGELTTLVPDITPPVIHMTGPYVVEATSPDGAAVNYTLPTATDDRDGTDPVSCTSTGDDFPGKVYPVGTTLLDCSAVDAAGNWDENEFLSITVEDTTPPVVTVPDGQTIEATGPDGATPTYDGVSAEDIVDGSVDASCTPATVPIGATTVTCTATDAHDNEGEADFTATVRDTTAPVVTVPADLTVPATSGSGADVSFAASALDSVDGSIAPVCSPASGSHFARGVSTPVTCTATDAHSNSGTASFSVLVTGVIITSDASAEDMSVEVSSDDGFAAGDYAVIDAGQPDQEVRYIQSIGSLDFAAPLASPHATGTLVSAIAPPQGDTTAPTISITAPSTGQRITKSDAVTVGFDCTDPGVGVEACRGSVADGTILDTSTVGTHTITVRSWDFNGNAATKTVSYTVVAAALPMPITPTVLAFTGWTGTPLVPVGVALLLGGLAIFLVGRRRRPRH
jgi:hypothetical protein